MRDTQKVELRCPSCTSTHVYTRKLDRRCQKCGFEGEKESFEQIAQAVDAD